MNADRRKQLRAVPTNEIREAVTKLRDLLEDARNVYTEVRDAEQEAFDNLPDSIQQGERGSAMQDWITLLDPLADFDIDLLDEISEALDDFENNAEL